MSKLRNINLELLFSLLIVIAIGCKKKSKDQSQEPCVGGCSSADFNLIDYQASWSPDGKYIAYFHIDEAANKSGIYLITPDGKENKLWHTGLSSETPSWSPDGQWITFSQGAQIWKKKLDGDSLTQITNVGRNFSPSWSPNGKWISNHRSYSYPEPESVQGIWVMNIHGDDKEQIFAGNSGYPTWNYLNDIIFVRGVTTSTGEVIGDSLKSFMFINKRIINLFFIAGDNSFAKYSKNNKISFTSQPVKGLPQIWVMDADGKNKKQVTQTGGYSSDWSLDGNKIVFTDSRATNGRLWIMNADGSNKQQLTFKENF
ncbi:TolB family protein [Pedobacter alpinus]|uniref:WD40-like Beta Propeller Repeat n=1 Tax=Pedobacter alpinus TaxID=1590643 RepID=A0ABW5TPC5_9SPHI